MDNLTSAIDVSPNHPLIKIEDVNIKGKPLREILDKHNQWVTTNGVEGMMGDLSYADLENVDLSLINLKNANLFRANLCGAKLNSTNLRMANLSAANLNKAVFCDADLYAANLRGATIVNTFLDAANLYKADLGEATILKSCLYAANLYGAFCASAIIKDIDFDGANLSTIRHKECMQNEYISGKILTNNIIGYKKCDSYRTGHPKVIVTLEIPEGAIVFSINGNKYRTNKAKVIAIDGADRAFSMYMKYMSYYVGDEFNIKDFDCRYNIECSRGIHFFLSKEEAINYNP